MSPPPPRDQSDPIDTGDEAPVADSPGHGAAEDAVGGPVDAATRGAADGPGRRAGLVRETVDEVGDAAEERTDGSDLSGPRGPAAVAGANGEPESNGVPEPGERPLAGAPEADPPTITESPAEAVALATGGTVDQGDESRSADVSAETKDGAGQEPTVDDEFGFPVGLWRTLGAHRPPGMPTPRVWRSPLRGPWLTSVLGFLLLISLPLVILTGLLDWIAYGPQFHQSIPAHVGVLHLPYFNWPSRPAWLFQLTEGLHVGLGLVLVPVVLAKLWSVMPKLFVWPAVRSVANLLERLSLVMIVGGIVFEMATGILNIQYDYIFGFSFYTAHYFGAWVFITGFVVHVSLKLPTMVASLRSRSLRAELRTSLADTRPEPLDPDGLVAPSPSEPTLSRRGVLAVVGGGSLMIAILTVGQTLGGVTRTAALLLPRGRSYGDGPNDFQINRTAKAASVSSEETGAAWQLTLSGGPRAVLVSRASLLAMEQHAAELPIACVEGWATTQHWSGVRLADLASLAGVPAPSAAHVKSLEKGGGFGEAWLQANQVLAPDALLALKVNGADLSLDHGFPARVIIPALPGVHCTKWVRSIEFVA